jgi:AraC family transcriptional regulator of adaptative response/methylated-DNA-[protein]-cysteine methyltransferase
MAAASIEFADSRCSLGWLLVAGTPRGVCFVSLGDDAAGLRARLAREFPFAPLEPAGRRVSAGLRAILRAVEGEATQIDVPLDVRGSRFERRVWSALRRIPRGETRSYGEVARSVGVPGGARAVGRACGANPAPIAIPCHRVIASDGSLGGYGPGLARKRELLAREGVGRRERS